MITVPNCVSDPKNFIIRASKTGKPNTKVYIKEAAIGTDV